MPDVSDVPEDGSRSGSFSGGGELAVARSEYARRLAGAGGLSSLNRVAALAARLLGTQAAQVSLVGDVQTVVGAAGTEVDAVDSQVPATDALCSITVQEDALVRISDAAGDPRAAHVPAVASGAVGAYLGVPLRAGGRTVGALCVFEDRPREWSDEHVALLEALATPVVAELELASLEASYGDDRVVWQLAVDAAGVGAFDWNLLTGELRWDERLLEMFGLERGTFGGTIEAFNDSVHPDDRERVTAALSRAIESCGDYSAEYRVVLPGGEVRWIAATGRALAGIEGTAVRVLGAAFDITAARDSQAEVTRVLESMPAAFFHLDRDWCFTFANTEAKRLLGGIGSDPVGQEIWELFPAAVGTDFERHYRSAVASGEPVTFEAYYPPPLNDWYEVRAWPTRDGLSVYFLHVTDRHVAQDAVRLASERTALLASVTQALTSTLDAEVAIARLAQFVVPALGDWCIISLVDDAGPGGADWRRTIRDLAWWHADPDKRPLVEGYTRARLPAMSDKSFVAQALQADRSVLIAEEAAEQIAAAIDPGPAHDFCEELDPWSAVFVPLRGRGRTAGLMSVYRDRARGSFGPDDVATLEDAAGRAGLALDNTRLYRQQSDLAETLQRSMMTAPPEPDHLHVAVRYVPAAEAAQVGGDWYDAFLQPDGATVVVIGDVVGHDTEAAAAMGQLRSILRGIAVTTSAGPAEVLSRVDDAMSVLQLDTTATVVTARFEQTPHERQAGVTRLRWSNAGHPPPIAVLHPGEDGDEDGAAPEVRVLWAERANLLLGLNPSVVRDETVATLPRGSTVLLYTDGLVERRGQPLDIGIERLVTVLETLVAEGIELEDLCDRLLAELLPVDADDDVALVAVRLHREDRPRPAEAGPARVPPGMPEPPPAPTG